MDVQVWNTTFSKYKTKITCNSTAINICKTKAIKMALKDRSLLNPSPCIGAPSPRLLGASLSSVPHFSTWFMSKHAHLESCSDCLAFLLAFRIGLFRTCCPASLWLPWQSGPWSRRAFLFLQPEGKSLSAAATSLGPSAPAARKLPPLLPRPRRLISSPLPAL